MLLIIFRAPGTAEASGWALQRATQVTQMEDIP